MAAISVTNRTIYINENATTFTVVDVIPAANPYNVNIIATASATASATALTPIQVSELISIANQIATTTGQNTAQDI
jgi:hypothetical protein